MVSGRWQVSDGGRSPGHRDSGLHFVGVLGRRGLDLTQDLTRPFALGHCAEQAWVEAGTLIRNLLQWAPVQLSRLSPLSALVSTSRVSILPDSGCPALCSAILGASSHGPRIDVLFLASRPAHIHIIWGLSSVCFVFPEASGKGLLATLHLAHSPRLKPNLAR